MKRMERFNILVLGMALSLFACEADKVDEEKEEEAPSRSIAGGSFGTVPKGTVTLAGKFSIVSEAEEDDVELNLTADPYSLYCVTFGDPAASCVLALGDADKSGGQAFGQACDNFAEVNFACFVRQSDKNLANVTFDVAPTLYAHVGELRFDVQFDPATGMATGVVDTSSDAYDAEAIITANTVGEASGINGTYALTCSDIEGSAEREECELNGAKNLYISTFKKDEQFMAALWTNPELRTACLASGSEEKPGFNINGSKINITSTAALKKSLRSAYADLSAKMKNFIVKQAGDDEMTQLQILLDLSLNPLPADNQMEEMCAVYDHAASFSFEECPENAYEAASKYVCYYIPYLKDSYGMHLNGSGKLIVDSENENEHYFPSDEEALQICPDTFQSLQDQSASDPDFVRDSLQAACIAEFAAFPSAAAQADAIMSWIGVWDGMYTMCKDEARNADIRKVQANSCMPQLWWGQSYDEAGEMNFEFGCSNGECYDSDGMFTGSLVGGERNIFKVSAAGTGFSLGRHVDNTWDAYDADGNVIACKLQNAETYTFVPTGDAALQAVSHAFTDSYECGTDVSQGSFVTQYSATFTP